MSVSLDDFGTGYSSLSYLKQLPINILKIDKSFIDNLLPNSLSYNLTEDIIMIAHKLGLLVIAEGVESIEQCRKLKQYNCDFIQGYLISRPLPAEHVENFWKMRLISRMFLYKIEKLNNLIVKVSLIIVLKIYLYINDLSFYLQYYLICERKSRKVLTECGVKIYLRNV